MNKRQNPVARGVLLLSAVLILSLVACGAEQPLASPTASGPTPTVTVPVELPVTVALSGRFGGGLLPILDEQIAAFEQANPDIRVEIVGAPTSADKRREQYLQALQDGDPSIDIYVIEDTWLAEFAAGGGLHPLDDYARAAGIEVQTFLPASLKASTLAGQTLSLPWTADGGFLYYRQDLLDRHGTAAPNNWPDLQKIALDVASQEGAPYGFVWQGAAYESLTCNTLEFVWAFGGDVLDDRGQPIFDSPQTRAALQQMLEMVRSGASPQDIATFGEAQSLEAFQGQGAVLMRNWAFAWDVLEAEDSQVAGRVAVAPLPASCLFGQNLALSAHSMHPDQAFRVMAFLTGIEQQVDLALNGGLSPALETAYHDEVLLAAQPVYQDIYAGLAVARPRPQTPAYPQVSEAIYSQVNAMLAGEQDVEETAANVQRSLESILQDR